jgi:hypothetical protein
MQLIHIGNADLAPIEYNGERVVTFRMIDDCHERPEGTAKRNFYANRHHFTAEKHYYQVCEDEIRTHKIMELSPKAHESFRYYDSVVPVLRELLRGEDTTT